MAQLLQILTLAVVCLANFACIGSMGVQHESWLGTCVQVFMAVGENSIAPAYSLTPIETHEKIKWLMKTPTTNKREFAYKKMLVSRLFEYGEFLEEKCSPETYPSEMSNFKNLPLNFNENIHNYIDYCENKQRLLCAQLESDEIERDIDKLIEITKVEERKEEVQIEEEQKEKEDTDTAAEGDRDGDGEAKETKEVSVAQQLEQIMEIIFEFNVGETRAKWILHPDMPIEAQELAAAASKVLGEETSERSVAIREFCKQVIEILVGSISKSFAVFVKQQDFYLATDGMSERALHWVANYRVCRELLKENSS